MMGEISRNDRISIRMFGFFDIFYNNERLLLDVGSSAKSLDILKFLLAQRGVVFLPETISENVWPNNDYLDQKKVVRTYIHRLRKLIHDENIFNKDFSEHIRILNVKGSYKLEISEQVEVDTDVFENYCTTIINETDITKLMDLFNALTEIYNRNFLEEYRTEKWVVSYRNYYLRNFCAAVNSILAKFEAVSDYYSIIEVSEKSLKVYDLDESINIYFLNALIATDKISSAMQHYSFITNKMSTDLSISPSEKMKSIYYKINPGDTTNQQVNKDSQNEGLRTLVSQILKETLSATSNKYSAGMVRVICDKSKKNENEEDISSTDIRKYLKFTLDYALRKHDMYTIVDDKTAIIILTEAREEFFNHIADRVYNSFNEHCKYKSYKLDVNIYPLIDIK